MTVHTKYALRRSRIAKVLNFFLAIATFEAIRAEGLVTSQYRQVLDLVSTAAAAVRAVVAY
jgi:spore maturation protein CgeB